MVSEGGAATIAQTRDAAQQEREQKVREHPLVKAVLHAFPGASITGIRTPEDLQAQAAADALPEVSEEWDPFEEE